jgi:hypothetical protein
MVLQNKKVRWMVSNTQTSSRTRFAFSVRTLMVMVLIVGGLFGWVGYRVKRAETQRRAVAQINFARGSVVYDYQDLPPNAPKGTRKATKPRVPDWLRLPLGDEYFQEVIGVYLNDSPKPETMEAVGALDRLEWIIAQRVTKMGDGLDHLGGLKHLKRVFIWGEGVTDASLDKLGSCLNLEEIWFGNADISDAGVAHLAGLPRLKHLIITNSPKVTDTTVENLVPTWPSLKDLCLNLCSITDKSLTTIGRVTQLESLQLSNTRVTDRGLASLPGLTRLQSLYLAGTNITDDGLVSLKEMTELVQIDLSETRITGEGFKYLGQLEKLSLLMLRGSKFSDAGMPYLAKLAGLQKLLLDRTQVSDAGLVHLKGMPKLTSVSTRSSRVTDEGMAFFLLVNPQIKGSNRPDLAATPPTPAQPGSGP